MNYEARIAELLPRVGGDVHAPAELLSLAAEYLKAREPVPDALADYLANAFRRAASTPDPRCGQAIEYERIGRLTHALGMTRREGRPAANVPERDVLMALVVLSKDEPEVSLNNALAMAFGVSTSTARNRVKKAKAGIAEATTRVRDIMASNELASLLPPRHRED